MTTTQVERAPRRARTGAGVRLNADHIGLYVAIVFGIMATAISAIVVSWNGLIAVAEWQGLPEPIRPATAVMVDVSIVVLTLGRLAKVSRGERARLFIIGAYGLTAVSSIANALHTVGIRGLDSFEDGAGAFLNALAPWLILLTTEALGSLVTRPKRLPVKRRRPKPKAKVAAVKPLARVEEGTDAA